MEQNFQKSAEQAARLLETPQGKALIRAFQSVPSDTLRAIRSAAQAGNLSRAQALLAPYLSGSDAEAFLALMGEGRNHG